MAIVELARIHCKAGAGDEFERRLKAGLSVQAEWADCLAIVYYRGIEEPDEFILQLDWSTVEAHLEWRDKNVDRWRAHISDLLEGLPERLGHYSFVEKVK